MKKLLFMAAGALLLASCSSDEGKVTIKLPADYQENTLVVSHINLDNMFSAKSQDDLKVVYDTLEVKNGIAEMKLDKAGAAWYNIESPSMTRRQPEFYAQPGDNLDITIEQFDPLSYSAKGTELMEDITLLNSTTWPLQDEYHAFINMEDSVPVDEARAAYERYDNALKQFVADHPKSPAVVVAILDLSGDDFKEIYDNMTPEAKSSILKPLADDYNKEVEQMLSERAAEQARMDEVASGTITAPGFTLPDLNGKMISLSDFKGKWVVLDFWGSWCGWCIKGFPALKKAYEQYCDKIVVIGIDCNDSEADWRNGVKEHKIPWINVYNGYDTKLFEEYNIEGFPTKAIINPEGKLVDLTTGEDPSFYDRLAAFVK